MNIGSKVKVRIRVRRSSGRRELCTSIECSSSSFIHLFILCCVQVFDTNNTGPLHGMPSERLHLANWHRREKLRAVMYTIDVYFSNGRWNGVDIAIALMFIVSFSLRFALPLNTFQIDRVFFAFTVIVCYFRLLRFWFVLQSIGPRIIAIQMMVIITGIVGD